MSARIAVLALAWALAAPAAAQPAPPPAAGSEADREPAASEIRRFLTGTNRVLITRRAPEAPIALREGTVTVSGLGAFEPGRESQRLLGLEIRVETDGEPILHYLDLHEIQSLLRAMPALRELAKHDPRRFPTAARHVSLEGFGVGLRLDGEQTTYLVHAGEAGAVEAALEAEAFVELEQRIALALDRLFNAAE